MRTVLSIIVGFFAIALLLTLAQYPAILVIPVILYVSKLCGDAILSWVEYINKRKLFQKGNDND